MQMEQLLEKIKKDIMPNTSALVEIEIFIREINKEIKKRALRQNA